MQNDIGKAFSYVFEDPDWIRKALIGCLFYLLGFVLIGIPFVVGYEIQIVRNVLDNKERPLPDWDNLGEKFKDGLAFIGITLVYSLPLILVVLVIIFAVILANAVALTDPNLTARQRGSTFTSIVFLAVFPTSLLAAVYGFLIQILSPALMVHWARTRDFGGAFRLRGLLRPYRAIVGQYAIALVIAYALSQVAGLGILLCFVGVFATSLYVTWVDAHLYGQLGRGAFSPAPSPPEAPLTDASPA